MADRARRTGRVLPRLLLLAAPFAVLALAEAVARLALPPVPERGWKHPYFRVLRRDDGSVCTDGRGRELWACDPSMASFVGREDVGRHFFPRTKDPGTVRIFSFGASTTYGLLYAPHLSYSRFLEERLRVLVDADVEVINAGISGYDSSDLPAVARESLSFGPDLFVVYAGHNEFKYPNLARVLHPRAASLARWLRRSRLLGLLAGDPGVPALPDSVAEEDFLGRAAWEEGRRGLVAALEEIVALAQEAGIPVVLCAPASNVRDQAPRLTVLRHPDPDARARERAELLALLGRFGPALTPASESGAHGTDAGSAAVLHEVEAILESEPGASLALFLRGRLLWDSGARGAAVASFDRSLELDGLPQRAPPLLVQAVRDVAAQTGAALVDVDRRFRELSGGAPGFDLFFDYCHPNARGHWWIADAILRCLRERELLFPVARYRMEREPAGDAFDFYMQRLGLDETELARSKAEAAQAWVGQALELPERREDLLAIAEEWFVAALRVAPELPRAHLGLAVVFALRGQRSAAAEELGRARRLDAEEWRSYAGLVASQPLLRASFEALGITPGNAGFIETEEPP